MRAGCAAAAAWTVAIALLLAAGGSAGGQLLVYEPFDYAAGTLLDGIVPTGENLTGVYVPVGPAPQQKLVVTSPGLDYGLLEAVPAAVGNHVSDTAPVTAAMASVALADPLLLEPGGEIFFSALFTFDDSQGRNHRASIALRDDITGDEISFGEPVIGSRAIRLAVATQVLGGLVSQSADGAFSDGDTLWLLGRYVNSASAEGDELQLLAYDTADPDVIPDAFDVTDPQAELALRIGDRSIDLARIDSVSFTIRGAGNNFIDELRVSRTYAALVLEPGERLRAGSSLLGLAACVLRRRRASGRARA